MLDRTAATLMLTEELTLNYGIDTDTAEIAAEATLTAEAPARRAFTIPMIHYLVNNAGQYIEDAVSA